MTSFWDWPTPDPRWDSPYNDQVMLTYGNPEWSETALYFVKREASQYDPKIGQVIKWITGKTGTQSGATNGLWWNKPSE